MELQGFLNDKTPVSTVALLTYVFMDNTVSVISGKVEDCPRFYVLNAPSNSLGGAVSFWDSNKLLDALKSFGLYKCVL